MSVPAPASPLGNTGPHSMSNGYGPSDRDGPLARKHQPYVERGSARVYSHLDDLITRSNPEVDTHTPMKSLLQKADTCAKQADAHLDFGRPDLAYVDYLTAFSIVVNLVPRHKDFPALSSQRGELWQLNRGLQKRINAQHEKFGAVRELIKEDNGRSGVKPTLSKSHLNEETSPPTLNPSSVDRQLSTSPHPASTSSIPPSHSPQPRTLQKARPPVQPKPESLHGRALLQNGHRANEEATTSPTDLLAERFANLRHGSRTPQPASDLRPNSASSRPSSSNSWHKRDSSDMQSSIEFTPSSSVASLPGLLPTVSAPAIVPPGRPSGPRLMPNGPPQAPTHPPPPPPHPPKIPLGVQSTNMPRAPSPTYSPAHSGPLPPNANPPRAATRTVTPNGVRPSSLPMANSTIHMSAVDAQDRRPNIHPTNDHPTPTSAHRRLPDLPHDTLISAQKLYDYLRRGSGQLSILFIDVRPRDRFDQGHIFAQAVMCVEPIALREDISAEELEESLVLSPEKEQALFGRRQDFDLVVYYDQTAASRPSLRCLHQALQDYNYKKPLQRPPVLLDGGLEAWIDLVGDHALATSDTASHVSKQPGVTTPPSGRSLTRGTPATPTARLEARRRLREQQPLDAEEENAWLERVRDDGGVRSEPRSPSQPVGSPQSGDASHWHASSTAEDEAPFVRTYDDFLRRYPEPSDVRESMVNPTAHRQQNTIIDHPFHNFTGIQSPLRPPPSIPLAPDSLVPHPPSRPAPSVPRKSYSGVSEKIPYPTRSQAHRPSTAFSPYASDIVSARAHAPVSRTGLTNFGATCYMNAVLQCLSATAPLTRYFLDGGYQRAVQRNKWGSSGILPKVYHSLMWHLWHGEYTFIAPKTFREFVSRLNKDFENPNIQHDANDFFVFILDVLHEDLNVNFAAKRPANLTDAEERRREEFPPQIATRIEWRRWSETNLSWVSSLFTGQHMSRLRCPACGFQSTSYETFNSIALEIPKTGRAHIYDCLKNYTREERLSADDCWTCPDCKVPREAFKKITITRAPQILVIQLKRFRSVRRGFTDKSNTLIEFPLTRLDITPYSLQPLSEEDERVAGTKFGQNLPQPQHQTTPPFEYDAYSVVQHFGTLTGGHYKALVRQDTRGHWLEFNDKVVSNYDPRRVQSEAAYLLFYVRSNVQ